nr:MAG TPA: hypothetical protein [Inoviridae sp.]
MTRTEPKASASFIQRIRQTAKVLPSKMTMKKTK